MVLGSQAYFLSFLINISEKVSPKGEVPRLTAHGDLAFCDNLDVASTDTCHHPVQTGFQWSNMTRVVSLHPKLPGKIHFQPASPVSKGQERFICTTTLRLWKAHDKMWKKRKKVKSLSRVWLWDPMDCSLPGSSVHGIFQATVLEWGAIAFSEPSTTSAEFQNFNWLHNNFPTPNQPCDTIYWLPLSPLWRMLTHLKVFRNMHDIECKTMCHLKNLIC